MNGKMARYKLFSGSSVMKRIVRGDIFPPLDVLSCARQSVPAPPPGPQGCWGLSERTGKNTSHQVTSLFTLALGRPSSPVALDAAATPRPAPAQRSLCLGRRLSQILGFRRQAHFTLIFTSVPNIVCISILTFCSPICFMLSPYFPVC